MHLDCIREWWNNRDKEDLNAYKVKIDEVIAKEYNLDFKNPNKLVEEKEYSLDELLITMDVKSKNIVSLVDRIRQALEGVEE